jgi:hypothetical protein
VGVSEGMSALRRYAGYDRYDKWDGLGRIVDRSSEVVSMS